MARLACVDIPFFALQLLFRAQPEWKELPAAVVDRDEPTGKILSMNEAARMKGVRPGMSYSQALSLTGNLRAGSVGVALLDAARKEVIDLLTTFTPEVEPCFSGEDIGNSVDRPQDTTGWTGGNADRGASDAAVWYRAGSGEVGGSFWLNAAGLDLLYPTLSLWVAEAKQALADQGFFAVIAVGFTRFGSYVIACSRRNPIVLKTAEQEEKLMRKAPLRVLPLSSTSLALFYRLGIETVGAFLDLPPSGVAKRFGRAAHRIFRWAQHERLPLQAVTLPKNAYIIRKLEDPVANFLVLCAVIGEVIEELVTIVVGKQKLIALLRIELFDGEEQRAYEEIRPAAPTSEVAVLKGLSRLRLSGRQYGGAIDRIAVSAEELAPIHRNGELFLSPRRQAAEAGKRAFAAIRARFGNDAVRRPVLLDAHMPEQRYAWETLTAPPASLSCKGAAVESGRRLRVVRRMFEEPPPVELTGGSVRLLAGPFVLAGKWWLSEGRREYYLARSRRGEFLWLYREGESEGWRVRGVVD